MLAIGKDREKCYIYNMKVYIKFYIGAEGPVGCGKLLDF